MTAEAWDLLVRRLEAKAKSEPRSYRLRVAALAALGYAVIGGALVVALGGLALTLFLTAKQPAAIKLLFVFGPLAWVILRALPVKLDPPQGIEVSPGAAPELWSLVESLRAQSGAPRIHYLLVDGDLNASVSQVPLFGWFGPTRNHLVVGLPLLDTLAPDEFQAVVAHELGHVSAAHGRFSAWVYRIRSTWERIQSSLQERGHWGGGIFRRFFRWYAPYFGAISFVLARKHEFEADREAVEAAGPNATATALARLDLAARYLGEQYWRGVYRAVETSPQPIGRPYVELPVALRSTRASETLGQAVDGALAAPTNTTDTHPSLSERLESIGVEPLAAAREATAGVSESAAERFLGSLHGELADRLDGEWRAAVAEWWTEEHRESQAAKTRLAELDERALRDELPREQMLEHGRLVERFRSHDEALPIYLGVLERDEEDPIANYSVGRILLERGEERGLGHLDRAMAADVGAILPACELAQTFLVERRRHEEADEYRARAHARLDSLDDAYEERVALSLRGNLRDPDPSGRDRRRPTSPGGGAPEGQARLPRPASARAPRRGVSVLRARHRCWVLELRQWFGAGEPSRAGAGRAGGSLRRRSRAGADSEAKDSKAERRPDLRSNLGSGGAVDAPALRNQPRELELGERSRDGRSVEPGH